MVNIKLEDVQNSENKFPKLMKRDRDNLLVLFNNLTSGVVLSIGISHYKLGNSYSCFNPNDFTLYNEKITLFN